jgi:hypothetical protein
VQTPILDPVLPLKRQIHNRQRGQNTQQHYWSRWYLRPILEQARVPDEEEEAGNYDRVRFQMPSGQHQSRYDG